MSKSPVKKGGAKPAAKAAAPAKSTPAKKNAAAMWGGRFSGGTAELVQEFLESQSYDRALYRQDIAGSKAHARMLAKQGVLTQKEAKEIGAGLDQVQKEIEAGTFAWRLDLEDVHMNIESRLTEIIGTVGKKLHTGRSRNDQVALDFRLYVAEAADNWQNLLAALIATLADLAEKNAKTLLPGFTHLQPAQPVSLAQHLLAYAFMFKRDHARLADANRRTRTSPLGAAALAGTTYPLDPQFTAKELGMAGAFDNSMDAVSDRDFAVETTFCASMIMAHLSRLCEDIILWANPAFGYVRLSDGYSTGSSIMPQKKNPDVAELMRGKTGRVYGALMSLLTTIKGLPMTYNRDLQEDKEPFFQTDRTVSMSLAAMSGMLQEMAFMPQRMEEALRRGFLNATELADYLVGKGIPFREAHHYTGALVALAEKQGSTLEDLPLGAMRKVCKEIGQDVYEVLTFTAAVARREAPGGTGPKSVAAQIKTLREFLGLCPKPRKGV